MAGATNASSTNSEVSEARVSSVRPRAAISNRRKTYNGRKNTDETCDIEETAAVLRVCAFVQ